MMRVFHKFSHVLIIVCRRGWLFVEMDEYDIDDIQPDYFLKNSRNLLVHVIRIYSISALFIVLMNSDLETTNGMEWNT